MIRSKSQTLITGVYRSGTEYTAMLVGAHPEICSTLYRVNLLRFIYDRYNPINVRHNYLKALGDLNKRMSCRYDMTVDIDILDSYLQSLEIVDYGVLYDVVMSHLYIDGKTPHWSEKCQLVWREIPVFHRIMPNPRSILVVRDPRAVLNSFKNMTNAEPPAYLGAIFNCLDAMTYARRFAGEMPEDRFMCVKYEDIARDPETLSQRMYDFLQLSKMDIDVRDQSEWRDAYNKPFYVNSSFHANAADEAVDVEVLIDRWKSMLSAEEIFLTEAICGSLMEAFGYELSGIKRDWEDALKLFYGHDQVMGYLSKWRQCGEGVEQFPSDPLDPSTWDRATAERED